MQTKTAPKPAKPVGNKIFEMADVVGGSTKLAGTGDYRNRFPAPQPVHPGLGMGMVVRAGSANPAALAGGWLVGVPFQQAVSQLGWQQLAGASGPLADGLTTGVGWLLHFLTGRSQFTLAMALSSTAPFLADGTQYLISWLATLMAPALPVLPAAAPALQPPITVPMLGRDAEPKQVLDANVVHNMRVAA